MDYSTFIRCSLSPHRNSGKAYIFLRERASRRLWYLPVDTFDLWKYTALSDLLPVIFIAFIWLCHATYMGSSLPPSSTSCLDSRTARRHAASDVFKQLMLTRWMYGSFSHIFSVTLFCNLIYRKHSTRTESNYGGTPEPKLRYHCWISTSFNPSGKSTLLGVSAPFHGQPVRALYGE